VSSYNKQKGTKFETDVMKYLRELGHFAERLAKAGSNDEGDIVTIIAGQTYILECKNRKAMNLPQFWDEAQTEAANYAKARGLLLAPPAFVIVKRRKASIEDAWVIQPLGEWINANTTRRDNNKRDIESGATTTGRSNRNRTKGRRKRR
jgi:Holliday junction resolvase